VETERIFETLSFNSGYCTFLAAAEDEGCNPDFGGSEYGG
jgi:hypothetical protein